MIKNIIKMSLILSIVLSAEVSIQEKVYDAADEMIAFDEKMNRLIREHNEISEEENEEMHQNDIDIEDFEESKNAYELTHKIVDANNTKVTVGVLDGVLNIVMVTRKKELVSNNGEEGVETTVDTSNQSIFIPNDADASSMQSSYIDGVVKIIIYKSKN